MGLDSWVYKAEGPIFLHDSPTGPLENFKQNDLVRSYKSDQFLAGFKWLKFRESNDPKCWRWEIYFFVWKPPSFSGFRREMLGADDVLV